jgi:hypothetical protein
VGARQWSLYPGRCPQRIPPQRGAAPAFATWQVPSQTALLHALRGAWQPGLLGSFPGVCRTARALPVPVSNRLYRPLRAQSPDCLRRSRILLPAKAVLLPSQAGRTTASHQPLVTALTCGGWSAAGRAAPSGATMSSTTVGVTGGASAACVCSRVQMATARFQGNAPPPARKPPTYSDAKGANRDTKVWHGATEIDA